jgi:limonene-1,2-epoxide hydrolase
MTTSPKEKLTMNQSASATPEQIVRAFFQDWENLGFVPAFERWMAPEAVWENTFAPCPRAEGRAAYMALLEQYQGFSQMPFARVEIKNLAVHGNTVMTERVDHLYDASRSRQHSAAIAGVFVIENGLISRYADYFDASQFLAMLDEAPGAD